MDKSMISAFNRVGNKRPIIGQLKFPTGFKTYVEPFVGSGNVFFGKKFSPDVRAVLNDKDKQLMSMFRAVKAGQFPDAKDYTWRDLNRMKSLAKTGSPFIKNLINQNHTFGSIGKGNIYKDTPLSNYLKRMPDMKEKLKNATLSSQDYKGVMRKHDGANTFFYLDPPYESSKDLYKKGEMNFEELASFLKTIKGKFLLSLNDSKKIRDLFKGFKVRGLSVRGQGNNQAEIGGGIRKELLISNY